MSTRPCTQPTAALGVRIGWETRDARDRALERYFRPFSRPARLSAPAPAPYTVTDADQETSLVRYSTWGIWTDALTAGLWLRANEEIRVRRLSGAEAIAYRRAVMAGQHPELSQQWRAWRCPSCGWPGWEGMLVASGYRIACPQCTHVDLPKEIPCPSNPARIPPQRALGHAAAKRGRAK